MRGVLLEIGRHLLLAGEGPAVAGERQARQAVVPGGGVEPQGVPLLAPLVSDARGAVEDDERPAEPLEVVAGREAGLAGADDDGLDVAGVGLCGHGP